MLTWKAASIFSNFCCLNFLSHFAITKTWWRSPRWTAQLHQGCQSQRRQRGRRAAGSFACAVASGRLLTIAAGLCCSGGDAPLLPSCAPMNLKIHNAVLLNHIMAPLQLELQWQLHQREMCWCAVFSSKVSYSCFVWNLIISICK